MIQGESGRAPICVDAGGEARHLMTQGGWQVSCGDGLPGPAVSGKAAPTAPRGARGVPCAVWRGFELISSDSQKEAPLLPAMPDPQRRTQLSEAAPSTSRPVSPLGPGLGVSAFPSANIPNIPDTLKGDTSPPGLPERTGPSASRGRLWHISSRLGGRRRVLSPGRRDDGQPAVPLRCAASSCVALAGLSHPPPSCLAPARLS